MEPIYLNQSGYVSYIKIAGRSILPPLVTEERRKEINKDKAKAIEIEKRLKRKRSSIDSGVMTGSYIEHFKNNELQPENLPFHQLSISDFISNENTNSEMKCLPSEIDSISTDSFLKSALEDTEFRDFFYSTAEKIFKDNNIVNINKEILHDDSSLFESNNVNNELCTENFDKLNSETLLNVSNLVKDDDLSVLDINTCSKVIPPDVESELTKCTKNVRTDENPPVIQIEKLSPPQRLVRRNSYTLESPSQILLEHMAKESINNNQVDETWKSLSENKDKELGFKTFPTTAKKPRKTWNKRFVDHSAFSKSHFNVSKVSRLPMKRSKTFVKPSTKNCEINYSLPCSSRTSPIHLSFAARSTDCIKSITEKSQNLVEDNLRFNFNIIPEPIKELKTPRHTDSDTSLMYENSVAIPNGLLQINHSGDLRSNCDADILFLSQNEPTDSSSEISFATQSTLCQQKLIDSGDEQSKRDLSGDLQDTVSVCSSLSLSKFIPFDDNVSRPSTTEGFSSLFSELQFKHECQIAELLEKQHKEKVLLSRLHSNNATVSSMSTTNLSIYELSQINSCTSSQTPHLEERTPCSRELFPNQISKPLKTVHVQAIPYTSEKLKTAALKLTACVRGYLTRRLLKTEKVQQLIDVIKESLNCAFSLQSEVQLKKTDLELHERLAQQLSAALYELQSIISAPVPERMAIIAADREKLRKPVSRPSSAISSATQKSILRRQQSRNSIENKSCENRTRSKSPSTSQHSGLIRSASCGRSDSANVTSTSRNRKTWR